MSTDDLRNRGISVIEYCILIIVVMMAVVTMQVYFKRAIQGRWRAAGDSIGFGWQYEPPEGEPFGSIPLTSAAVRSSSGDWLETEFSVDIDEELGLKEED